MKTLSTSRLLPTANLIVAFISLLLGAGSLLLGCKPPEPDDQPPVVVVEKTVETATLNTPVVLDASRSSDPENQSMTYKWTFKSKPDNSQAVILNADSPKAELKADKPGTYVLILTVTDSAGKSVSTEVTVTVALPGKPPVVSAGQSLTVDVGRRVTLDGSKTMDPDNDRLTYRWEFKTRPTGSAATISKNDQALAEFTPDIRGTYVLTLTASDGNWPAAVAEVTMTAVTPTTRSITGSWTAADGTGGGDVVTPRNHYYTFTVGTNNQPVSLTLTSSDINVGFYVYDPNGQPIDRFGSGFGRSQTEGVTVNAGTYTVLVCSQQRYDIGAYRLTGLGLASDFVRVPTQRVKADNMSFGPEGGGGYDLTSRNHYYTFDVTSDNALTDINAQSPDNPLWINLFSPSGARIEFTQSGTPRFFIPKLNKGTYGLWIGTGQRNAVARYVLDIFGQVANLKQKVFDFSILNDDYRGKNSSNTYTLMVTEDNTPLDITLRSPEITGRIELFNPSGSRVDFTQFYPEAPILANVNKGLYRIVVYPNSGTAGIGKFSLSVYGKFTDLKKQ